MPTRSGAAPRIVAFDIGGTHYRRAAFHGIRMEGPPTKRPTPRRTAGAPVSPPELVAALAHDVSKEFPASDAIGISFAGPITPEGVVVRAPNIFGKTAANVALAQALQGETGKSVVVVNDMTAAALAQRQHIGDTPHSFMIVTVSSGVGSKIDQGGRIIVGENGIFGEIGHMPIDPSSTILCGCGLPGHLEALASGNAALRVARELATDRNDYFRSQTFAFARDRNSGVVNNNILVDAAKAGDAFALLVLKNLANPLAQGVLSAYVMSAFERLYIIGGFALAAGDPYLAALRNELRSMGVFSVEPSQLDRFLATFIEHGVKDDNAGLIGAAIGAERVLAGKSIY